MKKENCVCELPPFEAEQVHSGFGQTEGYSRSHRDAFILGRVIHTASSGVSPCLSPHVTCPPPRSTQR